MIRSPREWQRIARDAFAFLDDAVIHVEVDETDLLALLADVQRMSDTLRAGIEARRQHAASDFDWSRHPSTLPAGDDPAGPSNVFPLFGRPS